jgi:hypothetical protein
VYKGARTANPKGEPDMAQLQIPMDDKRFQTGMTWKD